MSASKLRLVCWVFGCALIAIGLVLVLLMRQAPLSRWMISAADVERELARRSANGDPVQAEALAWPAAIVGIARDAHGPDGADQEDLLQDPQRLCEVFSANLERMQRRVDVDADWLERAQQGEAAELWKLDASGLAARWEELEWMQRDPARWDAATDAQRLDREIRNLARRFDTVDPCELEHPGARQVFLARNGSAYGHGSSVSLVDRLDLLWTLDSAGSHGAALETAAMQGDAAGVVLEGNRLACLVRWLGVSTSLIDALMQAHVEERFLRQIESSLPLLSPADRKTVFVELVAHAVGDTPADFARLVRAERAAFHYLYKQFIAGGRSASTAFGGMFATRPMHGEFLATLADYDLVLEALDEPSYADFEAAIEWLVQQAATGTRGPLSRMVIPPVRSSYKSYLRIVALQRCARVAAEFSAAGAEAARFFADATIDPFDGLPIRTRLRDDGVFEVWSVGEDLVDDGGATAGVPGGSDADIVFRVPAPTR